MTATTPVTRAAVLFALEREAAPFRSVAGRGVWVTITGIGPDAARRAALAAVTENGPDVLVFAGFCGALRPGLVVGDVVVPETIVDEAGRGWPCAAISPGRHGRLLTCGRLIATPAEKQVLAERFAADAVDMESAAVAEVCADRGVPFAAVRAVSDTAGTALSPRLVELLSGRSVSPVRAGWAVLRQPSLLGEFRRLARDTKIAAEKLASTLQGMLSAR